jgi:hypothetical protein
LGEFLYNVHGVVVLNLDYPFCKNNIFFWFCIFTIAVNLTFFYHIAHGFIHGLCVKLPSKKWFKPF